MFNIINPKPWVQKVTNEEVYRNRREVLKGLGLLGIGSFLASSTLAADMGINLSQSDNSFRFAGQGDYYPAERNQKYKLDRPITDKYLSTHQNNFYEFIHPKDPNIYNAHKYVDDFDNRDWSFEVSGFVKNKGKYNLEDIIKRFGLEERTYRFRCVEAWSMAVPWVGFPLSKLIKFLEPESKAKYVRFISYANAEQMPGVKNQTWYPWPYFEGLRMDEAMNELALMVTGIYGKPLPKQNGAPIRLIVPWKYGYKSAKSIVKIEFIDYRPETFWHKLAPREYGFFSNVDPAVPHPRWSQASEKMLGEETRRPTLKYNGYEQFVGAMYS